MTIQDKEVLDRINRDANNTAAENRNPKVKFETMKKVDLDIEKYREFVNEKVNNSDSAISKMILKNIDDDVLFNRTIVKLSNDIANDQNLYNLTLAMNTLKFLDNCSKLNHKRMAEDTTLNLAVMDVEFVKYKVALAYVKHIGNNVDLGKENKIRNMEVYNNEPSGQIFGFLKGMREKDVASFRETLKENDLYQKIKGVDFRDAVVKIKEFIKNGDNSHAELSMARKAYVGLRVDIFENKYANGVLERSFTASGFPTFQAKEREYGFDFLTDIYKDDDMENKITKGLKV